jgi:PAS domain-containing protein
MTPDSQTYAPEGLCRRIVEESRDAVIFADKEGIIRLWNLGAAAIIREVTARWE